MDSHQDDDSDNDVIEGMIKDGATRPILRTENDEIIETESIDFDENESSCLSPEISNHESVKKNKTAVLKY